MDDFNIWGQPSKGKKKKQEPNLFGGGFDLGIKPQKKQKNPFIGLGSTRNKDADRDSRRTFNQTQKNEIWAQQNGKCANCHNGLDPRTTEYDHVKPWADKGKTIIVNGAALCANCHKLKSHKDRIKKVDKKRPKKEDGGLFGGGNLFGTPPKRSKNNPFGL